MEDEIDSLFSSAPSAFTAERDALAARLRAEGDKDAAARVKALRRPTTAAWAVNQVARRQPQLVEEVRSAGEELERAQRRMMSGLRDVDLPEATRRRRAAVTAAVEAAAGFLSDLGTRPDPHVDKLRATFEAASLGGPDLDAVRAGRLAKELPPPSGFGGVQGLELLVGDAKGTAASPQTGAEASAQAPVVEATAQEASTQEDGAAEDAQAAEARAGEEARAAEARAAEERARAAVDQARERAEAAVSRARAARHRAAELQRSQEEAETEAAALERAAAEARRRADALATDVEDAREDERRLADAARRRAEDLREAEAALP